MIPDEAVEAAAKALYIYLDEDHRGAPTPWESLADDDDAKIDAREAAKIALEAAAPHMVAEALADAVDAFPLETITAPDNAVVWLRRRAEQIRPTP